MLLIYKNRLVSTCKDLVIYTRMNTKLIAVELHVKVGALALLSSEPLPDPARAY